MAKKDEVKLDDSKAGGLAFFLSTLVLIPLAFFGLWFIGGHTDSRALGMLGRFALGATGGALLAHCLIRGHTSVFIHELKHSIVANLVGNKATEWRIRKNAGHFQYEFTKNTRRFNAFISLAPYWLPVFTVASVGIGLAGWPNEPATVAVIVGLGWGSDALLSLRDISPYQTDFSELQGGFPVGLTHVLSLNVVILVLLLTLVGWGWPGFKLLLSTAWGTLTSIALPPTPAP